jgi:hypothetical protein
MDPVNRNEKFRKGSHASSITKKQAVLSRTLRKLRKK